MSGIYRKIHRVVLWYAVLMAPVTVIYTQVFMPPEGAPQALWHRVVDTMGLCWVFSLFYLIFALVFYNEFREQLLGRLSGFREGDEREQAVTGSSARATFLLMLAVEIVFLVMSVTSLEILRNPDGHGLLRISMSFGAMQTDLFSPSPSPALKVLLLPTGATLFRLNLLPANVGGIMLLLVAVQLLSFKLFARRPYKGIE